MTKKASTRAGIVLLVLSQGLVGCGGPNSASAPSVPSTVPPIVQQPTSVPQPTSVVSGIFGFVQDTGFRPLPGASVEVLDGPQAGTSVTADAFGDFTLTGTFDSTTRFRATSDGHLAATQVWNCSVASCSANGATPWLGFLLDALVPPVNLAGDYALTFVADSACSDIPIELRTRTYAATITIAPGSNVRPNATANTSMVVTLSGAEFFGSSQGFRIGVAGDYVDFFLDYGHDAPVVEQVAANTYLAFSGNATTTVGAVPSTVSARLDGWIDYCVTKSPMGSRYNCGTSDVTGEPIPGAVITRAHCESTDHRLILTRR